MFISTSKRSSQKEIMDDFELQGNELQLVLDDLKTVNRFLGGNSITIDGILKLTEKQDKSQPILITDVGCGDGQMLRECAIYARKNKFAWYFIGIDANPYIIEMAMEKSIDFPEIQFYSQNIFSEEFKKHNPDIFLCTLFLHHFNIEEIRDLIAILVQQAKTGVVVNDLQRSAVAYTLFRLFSFFVMKSTIAIQDGFTSITRGFKKRELEELSVNSDVVQHSIKWKWAFRYQWIIQKI